MTIQESVTSNRFPVEPAEEVDVTIVAACELETSLHDKSNTIYSICERIDSVFII